MPISWVNSDGKTGIAEDSYEFAMQHSDTTSIPGYELPTQERIDRAFDAIPKKRFMDQNNPLTWGLDEINQNIDSMMQDQGPKIRQQNEQDEIESGIARTPVERQASRDEEVDIRQAKLGEMLHDLRIRITGDPEKWATKEHIGDFVDKAMSVMGGGIRRPPKGGLGRGLTSSIGEERIQSAAMKVGDKVYEGENHGIAYEKAGDHNPAMAVEEGFTTNKGRFVSREEAAGIAKKQEQVLLEARQTENLHSGELKYGFERVPKPPVETSQVQWEKYMELSSQGKTTKQIIKATKMDPEVVRDALGRDNLALAAFNSENALTEAYFNQLKTMPPDLEKALRAKGVSVKDLKTFTRSLPEEDLAHIFQQLPENVKTWWQAGELRRQKIDEGKKASMIPRGSSAVEPLGPKPPRGTVKAGWDDLRANNDNRNIGSQKNLQKQKSLESMTEKEFLDYLASREQDFVKSGGPPKITSTGKTEAANMNREGAGKQIDQPGLDEFIDQQWKQLSKDMNDPYLKEQSLQKLRKSFKLVPKE